MVYFLCILAGGITMNKFLNKILNDKFLNYKAFYVLYTISFFMAIASIFYMYLYDAKCDYMLFLSAESCVLSAFGLFSMGISLFYILSEIKKDHT